MYVHISLSVLLHKQSDIHKQEISLVLVLESARQRLVIDIFQQFVLVSHNVVVLTVVDVGDGGVPVGHFRRCLECTREILRTSNNAEGIGLEEEG